MNHDPTERYHAGDEPDGVKGASFYSDFATQKPLATAPGYGITLAAFIVGFLLFTSTFVLANLLGLPQIVGLLLSEVVLLSGVAAFLFLAGYSLSDTFRLARVDNAAYPLAVQLGVALLFANFAATLLIGPSTRDIQLVSGGGTTGERIVLALTIALVVPLVEEALFRGLLQGTLERRLRPWSAIAMAALPFALLHGWPAMMFFLVWSLPLGWITWRSASIRPALVVHAINNLVGLIGLFSAGAVDPQSFERTTGHVVLALAVSPPAAVWVVYLCKRIGAVAGVASGGEGGEGGEGSTIDSAL